MSDANAKKINKFVDCTSFLEQIREVGFSVFYFL